MTSTGPGRRQPKRRSTAPVVAALTYRGRRQAAERGRGGCPPSIARARLLTCGATLHGVVLAQNHAPAVRHEQRVARKAGACVRRLPLPGGLLARPPDALGEGLGVALTAARSLEVRGLPACGYGAPKVDHSGGPVTGAASAQHPPQICSMRLNKTQQLGGSLTIQVHRVLTPPALRTCAACSFVVLPRLYDGALRAAWRPRV